MRQKESEKIPAERSCLMSASQKESFFSISSEANGELVHFIDYVHFV